MGDVEVRAGVGDRCSPEVVLVEAGLALGERAALEEDVAPDDLAGGEVAVLDALADVVLVDRLAEVAEVVGADLASSACAWAVFG